MQQITPVAPLSAEDYDLIRAEIHRNADAARDRMDDRVRVICEKRNHNQGRYLKYMRTPYHRGPLKRLRDAIENAWAMLYAMIVCYGPALIVKEEPENAEY